MKYSIEDLDTAIANVLGKRIFDALMDSRSAGRVTAHKAAIERAFMQHLDNADTDILRLAMNDLNKAGQYSPFSNGERS